MHIKSVEELIATARTLLDDKSKIITREDPEHNEVKQIYNRMHDISPIMFLQTLDPEVIKFVLDNAINLSIPFSIRGGGHHIAGFSLIDDGIVFDFSIFRECFYEQSSQTVTVQPGTRLKDLDVYLASKGRFVPIGTVSDTGVTGLTLGGGIGWFSGEYGFTCDNLIEAKVLLHDGSIVFANSKNHQNLFWAIKGGGSGAFGFILELVFKTFDLPVIIAGSFKSPLQKAKKTLSQLINFVTTNKYKSLTIAPTFLSDKSGNKYVSFDICCTNEAVVAELKRNVIGDWSALKKQNYIEWQSNFDQLFLPPKRGYWKSFYTEKWGDLTDKLIYLFTSCKLSQITFLVEQIHCPEVDQLSAFPLRNSTFGILVSARWDSKDRDKEHINTVKKLSVDIDPTNSGKSYSNYSLLEETRVNSSFSSLAVDKINSVRHEYDPQDIFKKNHSVR